MPTATAPLCGLLHCLPCVAKLKEANNHQMADPATNQRTTVAALTTNARTLWDPPVERTVTVKWKEKKTGMCEGESEGGGIESPFNCESESE